MPIMDIKVGQKIYYIEDYSVHEGAIASFINEKQVIVSSSTFQFKKTYGVDFFFTIHKANKVLQKLFEECNVVQEIYDCEISFNSGNIFIYSFSEELLKIFNFSNLNNEECLIELNEWYEILSITDKEENIRYYPNENYRVRILNGNSNLKIQYIYFNCRVYYGSISDTKITINYISSGNPDYLYFDEINNFDFTYLENNELLKLSSKTTNNVYYLKSFEFSKLDYFNSILTTKEKEKRAKEDSVLINTIRQYVKNEVNELISEGFPFMRVQAFKAFLYQSLKELYDKQTKNIFIYEVLLERNYEIICSAVEEIMNVNNKRIIDDNINLICELFSSDNNLDLDIEDY